MAEYKSFSGVVAFEPEDGETTTGKKLKRFAIKLTNSVEGTIVNCTLWEEMARLAPERNDFVVVEGSYESKPGKTDPKKIYHNLSVSRIFVGKMTGEAPKSGATTPAANTTAKPKVQF